MRRPRRETRSTFPLAGTINLGALGQLAINKNLTIDGPGAGLLTINAFNPTPGTINGDGSRVFNIDDGNATADKMVLIDGLTLARGDINGKGGAIFSAEKLTVTSSVLSGNATTDVNLNSGGAIYNNGGMLTIQNSTFSNNRSGDGGGAIFSLNGTTSITSSSFLSNSTRYSGGAIFSRSGTLTITASTISGNTGTFAGGGIHKDGAGAAFTSPTRRSAPTSRLTAAASFHRYGSLTINRCLIRGNTASVIGGGIEAVSRNAACLERHDHRQ